MVGFLAGWSDAHALVRSGEVFIARLKYMDALGAGFDAFAAQLAVVAAADNILGDFVPVAGRRVLYYTFYFFLRNQCCPGFLR
jgi:hypothetical protein